MEDKMVNDENLEKVNEEDSLVKDVEDKEEERLQELNKDVNEDEEYEEKKYKLEELQDRQKKAQGIFDKQTEVQSVSEFVDEDGNIISAREHGKVSLQMLNIEEDIMQVKRFRKDDSDVYALQDSIRMYGLLEPVHAVPFGDYYILVQGYRRLQALINLGKTKILAVVDSTIPPELAKYFQVEMNNVLDYTFEEKLGYGKFVESTQRNLGIDTIEQSLGLKAGDYLKMKYIEQFRNDFPDIYKQVNNEKLSIEQGYKKIDKEIEKQEKELDNMDELNSGELDDKLKDEDLSEIQVEANQQELGKRKPLDYNIKKHVESRAGGKCECCGYGKDKPELIVIFKAHHIIPVQFGGSDSTKNLILVCNNCHDIIHKYEKSEFIPEQDTYDKSNDIKRSIVLGNMILRVRKKALHYLRTTYHNIGNQVDKGVLTIGQGIQKSGMDLKGEKDYEKNSPYDAFYYMTEDLDFGGDLKGVLASLDFDGDVEEDKVEDDTNEDTEESIEEEDVDSKEEKEVQDEVDVDKEEKKEDDEEDLQIDDVE